MSDVTVVGTGLMGAAMARTLLRSGRSVTVWNRTEATADALVAEGAVRAGSASEAFGSSPVTLIVIKGYDAARDLLQRADEDDALHDVINLTTGTPGDADELAAWAAARDLALLEGAIFGFPSDVGTPGLPIVCAGDGALFERHQELLTTLGGGSFSLGPGLRLPNALDAALLTVMNAAVAASMEGLALGLAHHLDRGLLIAFFQGALTGLAATLDEAAAGAGHGADDATISTWKGGADTAARTAAEAGIRNRMAKAARETFQDAEAAGLGSEGMAAIVGLRQAATN